MRMVKHGLKFILLLVLLLPLAISAQDNATAITVAFSEAQPGTLDPAAAANADEFLVLRNVYEGLIGYDPVTLEPVPALAESWTVSDDGTVYTFTLRQGVTFSDGSTLDAADVKYTLDRLADRDTGTSYTAGLILGNVVGWAEVRPPTPSVGEGTPTPPPVEPADSISGVEVVDEQTVRITLANPTSTFLSRLTLPGGFIIPEGSADSTDFNTQSVGTGPYILTENTPSTQVVLTANPNYWGGAPAVGQVTIRVIPEQSVQVIEYEAGGLDIVRVPQADLPRVRGDANLSAQFVEIPTLSTFHLRVNLNDPVLGDPLVRRALAMAIDRQAIIDSVLQGQGVPADGLYPPGLSAYDADFNPFPYDPEAARALLAEAGYPDGVDIVFRTGQIETEVRVLNAIAQTAAPAGFNITVNSTERSVWDADRTACNMQAGSIAWGLDYPDPENVAQLVLAGTSRTRINCGYGEYEGFDRVQELFTQGLAQAPGEERIATFRELEQFAVGELAVVIPIYHGASSYLISPRIGGSPIDNQGNMRFANITLNS
ncbi:MAG: ABC transporter substrate-binding protein [Anaerolinea sp.]|nr:ABC transporter substrate-binding protein [Anaerolinea sp.]